MNKVVLPSSLPNLPSSIIKIQKMFNEKDVDFDELVNLLKDEPILCANILKLVNSPFYGLKNQVTSVFQALTLLGITIFRGIMMAVLLKRSFTLDLSPYEISIEEFEQISVLRVRLLQYWLKGSKLDLQYLSSLTFLMECGKIVLAQAIVQNELSDEFIALKNEKNCTQAELEFFETESYKVASTLFQEWMFEENFTNRLSKITNPQTDEEKILHILSKTIAIKSFFEEENLNYVYEMIRENGFDLESFKESVETIKKELS